VQDFGFCGVGPHFFEACMQRCQHVPLGKGAFNAESSWALTSYLISRFDLISRLSVQFCRDHRGPALTSIKPTGIRIVCSYISNSTPALT
jgi:hypothetical protein